MSVTVVTDSAATIPPDLVEQFGIVVVPIRIVEGDETYPDGVRSHQELLDSTLPVSTSGPSPGDFLVALEERGPIDEVLVLTLSHEMGESTHLAARAAANAAEFPMRIVDTETAAGAQGLVVLAAARVAASGASLDEVVAAATRVIERVGLVATLPNLDHLARSGHVPGAGAWAARSIGLHLIITLHHGKVRPVRPALSAEAAFDHMIDIILANRPANGELHLAVLQGLDTAGVGRLLEAARGRLDPVEMFVGSFGTGMIIHSGPGVLGFGWWWDEAVAEGAPAG